MSEKPKILFLCPYPKDKAPSQRLKFEQYFDVIEKNGFDIHFNSFISVNFWSFIYLPKKYFKKFIFTFVAYFKRFFILFTIRKYDIVYVHLWVSPLGPPIFEFILRKIHPKVIYDIDDFVFLGHSSNSNQFFEFLKGKSKMIYLMKKANHVITCTPYLDEFVRKYNSNTTDISSTVDTEKRYLPKGNYSNNDPIIIGWSGSHSTSKYLYLLKDVLKELANEVDYKLIILGDKDFHIEGVNFEAKEWKESIEIETLQKFDIGLYPLPFEDWVLGKSGLKAIQYMALGIPTVATDVGTIHRIVSDKENGFLIKENHPIEWKETLKKLVLDASLRKEIGEKGREIIVAEFSIVANQEKYLNILKTV